MGGLTADGALLTGLLALLGACMGSFLNVVAHRSVEGRPWWGRERSVCETCGRVLPPSELVPILSWLLQGGRCRGCGARLSPRYLVVELIGALGAGALAWRWGASWACALSLAGFFGLLVSALTDWEAGDVFDAFALATGAAGLLIRLAGGVGALLEGAAGALCGWGLFALIILASRGGMGWGDACFMGGMGAVLGWRFTLLAVYLGLMAGGAGVLALLLLGRARLGRGDSIPLVPFLALGCYLTLLWGPQLMGRLGDYLAAPGAFGSSWPFDM